MEQKLTELRLKYEVGTQNMPKFGSLGEKSSKVSFVKHSNNE